MPRFADIRGQDAALTALRRMAASSRVPHALLFTGSPGVGKTAAAFAFLQFLNCERPAADDACGACRTCHMFGRLQHPDLHWFFPMAGSEGGKSLKADRRAEYIAKITEERAQPGIFRLRYGRSANISIGRDSDSYPGSIGELRHEAGMQAMEARVKGFVVSEADFANPEAANTLLKTLEEPCDNNVFILCTATPGTILPTIRSRCRRVMFQDLLPDTIESLLVDALPHENERREAHNRRVRKEENRVRLLETRDIPLAAAMGEGSATRALEILEVGPVDARDAALEFLRLRPGTAEAAEIVEAISPKQWDAAAKKIELEQAMQRLFRFGALWLGDVLRAAVGSDLPPVNRDRAREVAAEARRLGVPEIRRRLTALERAERDLSGSVNPVLILHDLLEVMGGAPVES